MISHGFLVRGLVAALLFLTIGSANAAASFAPLPGLSLNPGDHYRYAFVTSTTRDGTAANIDDYNQFVQAAADSAGSLFNGSGIEWYAIASTASVAAKDNIDRGSPDSPFYLIDGTLLALSIVDLFDGSIASAISRSETGAARAVPVWTGSDRFGESFVGGELGQTSPFDSIARGSGQFSDERWLEASFDEPARLFSLYAVSEELMVPTAEAPLPPSLALLGLGLLGLLPSIRRRCLPSQARDAPLRGAAASRR